jgi:hypothetical protein
MKKFRGLLMWNPVKIRDKININKTKKYGQSTYKKERDNKIPPAFPIIRGEQKTNS